MKGFTIKSGNDEVYLDGDSIHSEANELMVYKNHLVVASFKNWDYWYEHMECDDETE